MSKASSYSRQTAMRRSWTSLTALRSSRGVDGDGSAACPLTPLTPVVDVGTASGIVIGFVCRKGRRRVRVGSGSGGGIRIRSFASCRIKRVELCNADFYALREGRTEDRCGVDLLLLTVCQHLRICKTTHFALTSFSYGRTGSNLTQKQSTGSYRISQDPRNRS